MNKIKTSLVSIIALAMACAAGTGSAMAAQTTGILEYNYAMAPYDGSGDDPDIDYTIVIDGVGSELAWTEAKVHRIRKMAAGDAVPKADFSANWRGLWDSQNLYLLVEVRDDNVIQEDWPEGTFRGTTTDGYRYDLTDCVQVFLDPDDSNDSGDGSPGHYYDFMNDTNIFFKAYEGGSEFSPPLFSPYSGIVKATGIDYDVALTPDGYSMEILIPFSKFGFSNFYPSEGFTFGLDIAVTDDDTDGTADGENSTNTLQWNSAEDNLWSNPGAFGDVTLDDTPPMTAAVYKTKLPVSVPTNAAEDATNIIDAAWDTATARPLDKTVYGAENEFATPEDFSCQMKTLWDDEGIYFLVEVTDELITGDALTTGGPWCAEGVEFFFDANNSGDTFGSTGLMQQCLYNNVDQYQLGYPLVSEGTPVQDTLVAGACNKGKDLNVSYFRNMFPYGIGYRDGGWWMEIMVPWDQVLASGSVPPPANHEIGLEIAVNDDDEITPGVCGRQNQFQWASDFRNAWNAPSGFGEVILFNPGPVAGTIAPVPDGHAVVIDGADTSQNTDSPEGEPWKFAYYYRNTYCVNSDCLFLDPEDTDFDARWRAMYDEDNLYVLVEVVDDVIVTGVDTPANGVEHDDSVELFFDPDNSGSWPEKQDWWHYFDKLNDVQLGFVPSADSPLKTLSGHSNQDFDLESVTYATTETNNGYIMEIQVPFAAFGEEFADLGVNPGAIISMDVVVNDDDDPTPGNGGKQNVLSWANVDTDKNEDGVPDVGWYYSHPDAWGDLTLGTPMQAHAICSDNVLVHPGTAVWPSSDLPMNETNFADQAGGWPEVLDGTDADLSQAYYLLQWNFEDYPYEGAVTGPAQFNVSSSWKGAPGVRAEVYLLQGGAGFDEALVTWSDYAPETDTAEEFLGPKLGEMQIEAGPLGAVYYFDISKDTMQKLYDKTYAGLALRAIRPEGAVPGIGTGGINHLLQTRKNAWVRLDRPRLHFGIDTWINTDPFGSTANDNLDENIIKVDLGQEENPDVLTAPDFAPHGSPGIFALPGISEVTIARGDGLTAAGAPAGSMANEVTNNAVDDTKYVSVLVTPEAGTELTLQRLYVYEWQQGAEPGEDNELWIAVRTSADDFAENLTEYQVVYGPNMASPMDPKMQSSAIALDDGGDPAMPLFDHVTGPVEIRLYPYVAGLDPVVWGVGRADADDSVQDIDELYYSDFGANDVMVKGISIPVLDTSDALATWNFDPLDQKMPGAGEYADAATVSEDILSADVGRGSGAKPSRYGNAVSWTDFKNDVLIGAIMQDDYISLTIAPQPGGLPVTLTGLTFYGKMVLKQTPAYPVDLLLFRSDIGFEEGDEIPPEQWLWTLDQADYQLTQVWSPNHSEYMDPPVIVDVDLGSAGLTNISEEIELRLYGIKTESSGDDAALRIGRPSQEDGAVDLVLRGWAGQFSWGDVFPDNPLADGWGNTYMGWLYAGTDEAWWPWTWSHTQAAYLYFYDISTPNAAIIHDMAIPNVIFTNGAAYPWMWFYNPDGSGGWFYYYEGTSPRLYYDWNNQNFITY